MRARTTKETIPPDECADNAGPTLQLAAELRTLIDDLVGIAIAVESGRSDGLADELRRVQEVLMLWKKPGRLKRDKWAAIVVIQKLSETKARLDGGSDVETEAKRVARLCAANDPDHLGRVPLNVWIDAMNEWRGWSDEPGRPRDGQRSSPVIVLHVLRSAGMMLGTSADSLRDGVNRELGKRGRLGSLIGAKKSTRETRKE